MAASSYAMPHSSYICAHTVSLGRVIPFLQNTGVVLDFLLLIAVDALISRASDESATSKSMSLLGWLPVVCIAIRSRKTAWRLMDTRSPLFLFSFLD